MSHQSMKISLKGGLFLDYGMYKLNEDALHKVFYKKIENTPTFSYNAQLTLFLNTSNNLF